MNRVVVSMDTSERRIKITGDKTTSEVTRNPRDVRIVVFKGIIVSR